MNQKHDSDGSSDLDEVLANYLRRVDRGEKVDRQAFIDAHPNLASELRAYFSQAVAVDRLAVSATADFADQVTPRGALEVRCPTCHVPMEVAVDTQLTDLTCCACGSHFSLVNQNKATWMAPALTKLGRFDLIERLGVGGFGSVWKARDKELDRVVAIKIPRAGEMTADEQEKFFREARAAAQLRHPNIVSVHEVGRDGESIYIVSDLVRGVMLSDWLTRQQLSNREAAELCAKIADALHHAHEQGVVHRDLKPANIMMDYGDQPHLMDFGLARRETGEVTMTVDGQILGTPAYMSPEQAQGEAHAADRRSDVYSLGVILFQLLTGNLPFRGNARMLIKQVIQDEPPSPRKLNGNVSKDLETLTLKCLEKVPARRYKSAQELSDELRRILSGEPIQARPISRLERSWRWAQRKPMMATTAALVVILAIVGPLAALIIDGQRRELEVRYTERDNLIDQQEQEMTIATNRIAELSRQLSVWEGRANPWEFWPPKQSDSLRQNIVTDLFNRSVSTLGAQLRDGKHSKASSARGYFGLAVMADALGRVGEARKYYRFAREKLESLQHINPEQPQYLRGLAECQLSLARLADDAEKDEAEKALEQARALYKQLAADHKGDASFQVDWLESEWASAKMIGFESGQDKLGRVSQIKDTLPSKWPSDPDALYRLACFLTRREPILADPDRVDAPK